MKKWILILPLILLLAACGSTSQPESEASVVVVPEPTHPPVETATVLPATAVLLPPTAVPTDPPTAEPTRQPTALPTSEPVAETAVIAGRLDEGSFFLGAPGAPVTMIDYSDFL